MGLLQARGGNSEEYDTDQGCTSRFIECPNMQLKMQSASALTSTRAATELFHGLFYGLRNFAAKLLDSAQHATNPIC